MSMCSVTVKIGDRSRAGFDSQFFISSSGAGSYKFPVACCLASEHSVHDAPASVGSHDCFKSKECLCLRLYP